MFKLPPLPFQTRLVVSLVLLDLGASNPSPAFVEDTVRDVTSSFRVQGRTAYVSASLGKRYAQRGCTELVWAAPLPCCSREFY